ncbi:MAG: hypothetical protein ACI9HE_001594 [Planctomycetota bacterium]|jgi:hypothetical protein
MTPAEWDSFCGGWLGGAEVGAPALSSTLLARASAGRFIEVRGASQGWECTEEGRGNP